MRTLYDEKQRLCTLLKDYRKEAGLRQTELATKLGRVQSYVSKYESGERSLEVLELRKICLAMGIKFTDFVKKLEDSL